MSDVYAGREQTGAKHFILKRYLQRLAFKILTFSDITFVDGFSGPWACRTEDFADTSFKIAIDVLRDAQERVLRRDGGKRLIRCFFSEVNPVAYRSLEEAVRPFHRPQDRFEVRTYGGRFEDAVVTIGTYVGTSIPLVFIDPTGWTGFPLDRIAPLFAARRCEVLVNYMYDHVNRFIAAEDDKIIASFDPILGGPGWVDRLDRSMGRGLAVEKLFRDTLAQTCGFNYVVSTKIDKARADRPHFFITYGTKEYAGLKAFRDVESEALRSHSRERAGLREQTRNEKTGMMDLFADGGQAVMADETGEVLARHIGLARSRAIERRDQGGTLFEELAADLMQAFIVRETNVKDICVGLAREGIIQKTWGGLKPREGDHIRFTPLPGTSVKPIRR